MSMTREEAKEILSDWNLCHYTPSREAADAVISALDPLEIISALRPVSREQVEKVLRGEWGRYCFSDDSHGYQCKNCGVQLDDPVYYRSFCPKCGKAMTDKAVEMVMKRMEEMKNG